MAVPERVDAEYDVERSQQRVGGDANSSRHVVDDRLVTRNDELDAITASRLQDSIRVSTRGLDQLGRKIRAVGSRHRDLLRFRQADQMNQIHPGATSELE